MRMVVTLFDDEGKTNPVWVVVKNIPEKPIDQSDLWDNWTGRLKLAAAKAADKAYGKRLRLLEQK